MASCSSIRDKQIFSKDVITVKDIANQDIINLVDSLKKYILTAICIPPDLGSSGYTFLCEYPVLTTQFKRSKFVLKFLPSNQAYMEQFCSNILKQYGFMTPDIIFIDPEVKDKIFPFLVKHKPAMQSLKDEYQLIYMNEFQASTLASIITLRKWKQLKCKESFFYFCGKLAVIDLFIGNEDRLIRFSEETSIIQHLKKINSGNLMIDEKFERFFAIDNSSICQIKEDRKTGKEEFFSTLFDEKVEEFDEKSKSQSKESTIDTTQLLAKRIRNCHKIFSFFLKNQRVIAKLIINNLEMEFNNEFDFSSYEKVVLEGIRESLNLLNTKIINLNYSVVPYCQGVLDLMKLNLKKLL